MDELKQRYNQLIVTDNETIIIKKFYNNTSGNVKYQI